MKKPSRRFKVIDVVGARPQFVKVSAVARAFARTPVDYVLVNTDQHYDEKMAKVFFSELEIQAPNYSLGVGSGSHGEQTAKMLAALEAVFQKEKPDLVQVYGDTNSTIAAALAAAKLWIPVSHVEAGLRSFNRKMPEEVNRVVTDHLSQLLFVPTKPVLAQLKKEGITKNAVWVGDVMLDVVEHWKRRSLSAPRLIEDKYALATIHRAENTDDPERLKNIIGGFADSRIPILLPVHPRLQKMLDQFGIRVPSNVKAIEPISHFNMMAALHHAECVVTDSGGLQKEAFYMGKRCVTVRDETEWVELVKARVNTLTGTNRKKIAKAVTQGVKKGVVKNPRLFREYGAGKAAERVVERVIKFLNTQK